LREAVTQPLEPVPGAKLEFSLGFAIANNLEEFQNAKNRADQQMYADKNRRKLHSKENDQRTTKTPGA
jgi:hypothetical protein